jgi:hypothetical protein
MVSRSVLAACGLAAALSLASVAQSTSLQSPSNSQGQAAPAQPSTPKLQLQDLPPDPHTPTAAEAEQQHQQAVINAAMRLATMQARWGPGMSTPGLSIALTETGRAKTTDGTKITYRITGTGFTADDKMMLVRWPLNAEAAPVMGGISFDTKGVAICTDATPAAGTPDAAEQSTAEQNAAALGAAAHNPTGQSSAPAAPAPKARAARPDYTPPPLCTATMQPQQPVEIQVTAAPGEPLRLALLSPDRKRGAALSMVPFPVAMEDKGCKLQVILGVKDAALVLVDGTGFPPNTPLKIEAVTGDDTRTLHPQASADGRILMPLLVGAKGKTSGETTVRFAGVNHQPTLETPKEPAKPDPDCAPAVSFPWGNGSYKVE